MMHYYYDFNENTRALIDETINKNGFSVEHNYCYLLTNADKNHIPVFVYFGDHKGILALKDRKKWTILMEVMAPRNERINLFKEFAQSVLKNSDAIYVEFLESTRKELIGSIKGHELKIGRVTYHYTAPIIYMDEWDPELKGASLSKLRKAKARFFRKYDIKILEDEKISQLAFDKYKTLIKEWIRERKKSGIPEYYKYIAYFRDFIGQNPSMAIIIDGKLCAVAAGWDIPNSKGGFYYAISLHNYSISELGDFLNVLFLEKLKKHYKYVDFGGGDEQLTSYKKKFLPKEFYNFCGFYVIKDK